MDTENPRGCSGESCKEDGTYTCAAGKTQYFNLGDAFPTCPVTGEPTQWTRSS